MATTTGQFAYYTKASSKAEVQPQSQAWGYNHQEQGCPEEKHFSNSSGQITQPFFS